ncbi:MAG: oligosaccharide flippase family protein [Dehalococcoidia bacterium]|jgi:O-antigen/teichoic acid export membrane protein
MSRFFINTSQIKSHLKDPLYRNSYFLMANTAVTSALGFAFWIVVARFYNDADVGLASTIITCMGLLVTLSSFGFDIAFIRFLNKSEKPAEFINSGLTITGLTALFVAFVFVMGVGLWSPALSFLKSDPIFASAFIVFTIFLTLSSILDYIFIAKRRAGFVLTKNTIISLLKITLPFIFVSFFRSFGIVSSLGTATALIVIVFLLFFLPRVQNAYKLRIKTDLHIVREVWRYSAGNYLANIFTVATTFILLNLIIHQSSAEEAAYFYIVWMITGLLFIIPGAISQSLFAEGSHFEDKLDANVKRAYKLTFMLLIPAIIVLLLAGKWLLLAFGAGYSENGVSLLRFLALSGVFIGVNSVYYTVLRVRSRIRELIAIIAFTTIATLAGSYFLMHTTGIVGIGYIWFAVQGAISIYVLSKMKKLKLN